MTDRRDARDVHGRRREPEILLEELWCIDDPDTGLTWLVSERGGRLKGETIYLRNMT